MKSFLTYTLATVVGIVIAVLVLVFIGVGMVSGLTSSKAPETVVDDNSVLLLDLNGTLCERVEENPIDLLLGADYESYGLDDILSAIRKAKENDRIKGIYIKATLFSASSASREEIRRALLDFKDTGKFIVAYGDTYTQGLYYLASVADKVLLNPQGVLEWRGLAAAPMFYKSLLDKVGVEMQVFKVGTYKSAVEPYLATGMSEANRLQVNAYLSSIWGKMVADVSASRGLSPEALNAAADSMLAFRPAEAAVEAGLVDTLMYQNDVRDYLKAMAGLDEDEELPLLDLEDMKGVKESRAKKKKSGDIIAVYYAFGELDLASTYTTGEGINSQKVIKDLRKLKEDKHVKAVVLRVNSPGGSAYGAEQIWYAVNELKKEKPVVVSMGDYAASGGYYISSGADCIVAEATTLTGSIGIYGIFPNAKGLADKVGLDFDVVKTNRYADFGQLTRPMDDGEKALLQQYINRGYDLFLTRCAQGRGMSKEAVDKIAQGRVWSGTMALALGLVDKIGGIDRAVETAAERAGLETYSLRSYPAKRGMMDNLMDLLGGFTQSKLPTGKMRELYRPLDLLMNWDKCDPIQAHLPFEPNIR